MPFSPAHVEQTWNRIHRIGQHAPITGKVQVLHLVPHGSIDAAIGTVHGDKQAVRRAALATPRAPSLTHIPRRTQLINLVVEGDDSGFGGETDSQWRKAGRIVDACLPMLEDGCFPPMPMHKTDPATSQPLRHEMFELVLFGL